MYMPHFVTIKTYRNTFWELSAPRMQWIYAEQSIRLISYFGASSRTELVTLLSSSIVSSLSISTTGVMPASWWTIFFWLFCLFPKYFWMTTAKLYHWDSQICVDVANEPFLKCTKLNQCLKWIFSHLHENIVLSNYSSFLNDPTLDCHRLR